MLELCPATARDRTLPGVAASAARTRAAGRPRACAPRPAGADSPVDGIRAASSSSVSIPGAASSTHSAWLEAAPVLGCSPAADGSPICTDAASRGGMPAPSRGRAPRPPRHPGGRAGLPERRHLTKSRYCSRASGSSPSSTRFASGRVPRSHRHEFRLDRNWRRCRPACAAKLVEVDRSRSLRQSSWIRKPASRAGEALELPFMRAV